MNRLAARLKSFTLWRRVVQGAALLGFLYLLVFITATSPGSGLAGLFLRLDPLVAVTAMLAGRSFIAGMALAGITVLLTLLFGRAWCGWLCPMGTVLDLLSPRRKRKDRPNPPPERWRWIKYALLVFLLAAALLGSQSFLFLDPITLLTRTLTVAAWPALGYAAAQVEAFLYQFEVVWGGLDALHAAVIYPLFRDAQPVYWAVVSALAFFAGIAALNWAAERFWCRYLCPLGGLLGLFSRFSLFRRVTTEACGSCGACGRRCPTGAVRAENGFASDPAECILCMECVEACPKAANPVKALLPGWKPAPARPYDVKRREALGLLGAAAAWAAVSGAEPVKARQPAMMIRPPGAQLGQFEALCARCGECIRACVTHGLQPSGFEGGWQNLLTPRLEPRLGSCSYNCAACGQVCPSGAIPKLTLEQKRVTPIGLARVDRTRCLPWAYAIDCIVCEESCPLGTKAIRLDVVETTNARGEPVTMQRPYVVKELCIGCGMCEQKCPMGGDAAIRVFAYSTPGGYDPTL